MIKKKTVILVILLVGWEDLDFLTWEDLMMMIFLTEVVGLVVFNHPAHLVAVVIAVVIQNQLVPQQLLSINN